jgi:hypothetical protein
MLWLLIYSHEPQLKEGITCTARAITLPGYPTNRTCHNCVPSTKPSQPYIVKEEELPQPYNMHINMRHHISSEMNFPCWRIFLDSFISLYTTPKLNNILVNKMAFSKCLNTFTQCLHQLKWPPTERVKASVWPQTLDIMSPPKVIAMCCKAEKALHSFIAQSELTNNYITLCHRFLGACQLTYAAWAVIPPESRL